MTLDEINAEIRAAREERQRAGDGSHGNEVEGLDCGAAGCWAGGKDLYFKSFLPSTMYRP